ncbi:MAG: hypothetical protein KDM63_21670, partial [Verrucomicrobiae bacterium]|nr:hypothetical protein [Verrucomicrobiae bacterium]
MTRSPAVGRGWYGVGPLGLSVSLRPGLFRGAFLIRSVYSEGFDPRHPFTGTGGSFQICSAYSRM